MHHSDHTGSREHSHAPTTMQHNHAMHAKAIKCYAKVTIPLHGYGMRVPAPVTDEKNGTTGTPPSMVLASTPDYISHRWRRQLQQDVDTPFGCLAMPFVLCLVLF